jgi:hypothetical protein
MVHYLIWITVAVFVRATALRIAIRPLGVWRLRTDGNGASAASPLCSAAMREPAMVLLIYAISREARS